MKRLCALLILCTALPVCGARTVTDELGRVVKVPEHPHRLVCLLPSVVDDVYALGAGADVVAVTDYTKYPAEAKAKPSVGLPLAPSMETILSLHPDLVLGSGDLNRMETLQQLEKLGIAVFMVSPHGVEGDLPIDWKLGTSAQPGRVRQGVGWQAARTRGSGTTPGERQTGGEHFDAGVVRV
jgi:ABC-type hemin transport system substrate-binding protein